MFDPGEVGGHEGTVFGYIAPDVAYPEQLRELGAEWHRDDAELPLEWISSGCGCGWRSSRWRARRQWPERSGTGTPRWVPSMAFVAPDDREIARLLYQEHLRAVTSDHLERTRLLAMARLHGPPESTHVRWLDEHGTHDGRVLVSQSWRDKAGHNVCVMDDRVRDTVFWIDSGAIIELLP